MFTVLFPVIGEVVRKVRDDEPLGSQGITQRLTNAFGVTDQSQILVGAYS